MITTKTKLTLEDYFNYKDNSETRYELEDGQLISMPPESDQNNLISLYLLSEFLKLVSFKLIRHKDMDFTKKKFFKLLKLSFLLPFLT
jgi:Uma2 family endonuclease